MKKVRILACLMVLGMLVPAIMSISGRLPSNTQSLIEKKYGDWAGVIRMWVCEGWPTGTGSIAAWLNPCLRRYEKEHPGVYIQPEYVDASTLAALGSDGLLPPDLVLFPPGALKSPDMLLALNDVAPLRRGLNKSDRAIPILMGGYMWAYNAALLDDLPASWRDAEVAPTLMPDETWRHWSTALLALCSGYSVSDLQNREHGNAGSLELGLPDDLLPTPSSVPPQPPVPCQLPKGFSASPDAWQDFINGDAAAMPVTQREVRRLQSLSDQGCDLDWRLGVTGNTFTDQLLYLGIVNRPSPDEKLALCHALVAHLLSDDCQNTLHRAGAFSVTDIASGYAVGDPLCDMDTMLRANVVCVPGPFDTGWSEDADNIVRVFLDNSINSAALWRQLSSRLK